MMFAWHFALAQKEVRFDLIGKDLIIQDSKRLRRRLPERLSCSGRTWDSSV